MHSSITAAMRQTSGKPRLIVVEDDPVTLSMLGRYFRNEGFDVDEAPSAAACRALMAKRNADLIFLDIHLPDVNGIVFAQELRSRSPVGIIFVTQRDSDIDKIVGLESAGDDYVTKPVNLRELLARARALLRRRQIDLAGGSRGMVLTFGQWILDLNRRELTLASGEPVKLTRGEVDLLAALANARGQVLSRDYLFEVVSNRLQDGDIRTVDSLVARIRRKLDSPGSPGSVITTVTGSGYRIGMPVDQA